MNLLDIIKESGLEPVRDSGASKAEYSSACPICGGTDRFIVWANKNKFWCRSCGIKGDDIDYLMNIRGLSIKEAMKAQGREYVKTTEKNQLSPIGGWSPKQREEFPEAWVNKAFKLIEYAHKQLFETEEGKHVLKQLEDLKGIKPETARHFLLGWNPKDIFQERIDWGLPDEIKDNGQKKKIWIPAGLVIPSTHDMILENIRFRLKKPFENNKYVLLSGSRMGYLVTPWQEGNRDCFLVESDLDAMLLYQEAGDLACFVATGSTSNKPGTKEYYLLKTKNLFLSLDSDDAGRKAVKGFWKDHFSEAEVWPVIEGKDPSEAFKNGLDLRTWIQAALIEN